MEAVHHKLRRTYDAEQARVAQLQGFRDEYTALLAQLSELPKRIDHQIMVPFGKLAFMPGKLVHSNEVLVLLGDDYFAWRSAAQAGEIVQRRIAYLDDKLADAHATRARIANALGLASTVASEHQREGIVDIREEYTEEDEARDSRRPPPTPPRPARDAEARSRDLGALMARLDELAEMERQADRVDAVADASAAAAAAAAAAPVRVRPAQRAVQSRTIVSTTVVGEAVMERVAAPAPPHPAAATENSGADEAADAAADAAAAAPVAVGDHRAGAPPSAAVVTPATGRVSKFKAERLARRG